MRNVLISQLYTVDINQNDAIEITLADENHPVFLAHFEGNPLLPAFLQIDILASVLNLDVLEIARSKFMEPIRPNDTIRYTLIKDEAKPLYKVKVSKCDKPVSEFTLVA